MGFSGRNIPDLLRGCDIAPGTKPKRLARNTMRYINRDGATVYRLHNTNQAFVRVVSFTLGDTFTTVNDAAAVEAEVESARLEYVEMKHATRRASAEKRKAREVARKAAQFGAEWFADYTAETKES